MRYLGYNNIIVQLLESQYRTTKSEVREGKQGDVPNWFETLVGILQGCVVRFNIMLEIVMALADNLFKFIRH